MTSKVTLALTIAAVGVLGSTSAPAQTSPPPSPPPSPQSGGPTPTHGFETNQYMYDLYGKTKPQAGSQGTLLSKQEQRAIKRVEAALGDKDYPAATAAIHDANNLARSNHAKYAIAALQLQLGTDTGDEAVQDQAIDAALAAGVAPPSVLPTLYRKQGIAAMLAKDYAKAGTAFGKVLELTPEDADTVVLLAETKNRANQPAEALALFEKAISLTAAAGLPIPAEWSHAASVMRIKMGVNSDQR